MKARNKKNELLSALRASLRPIAGLLFAALIVVGLFGKQSAHAVSDRAKKVAGIFIGGGTGGGIAAIAGSAKWFPLGFGVGGLAGGLIARHVIKKRRERAAERAPYQSRRVRRRQQMPNDTQNLPTYPAPSARRHVKSEY